MESSDEIGSSESSSPPLAKTFQKILSRFRPEDLLPDPAPGLNDFLRKRPGFDGVAQIDVVAMTPGDWFRVDNAYDNQIDLKRRLLAEYPDEVCQVLQEDEPCCTELLQLARSYIAEKYPGDERFSDLFTKEYEGLEALQAFSQHFQEDVLLIRETESGTYRMVAGSVFFPSSWVLKNRIGQELPTIHAEVPELNERIGAKIDRFLQKLTPHRQFERINFLIYDTDQLPIFPQFIPEHSDDNRVLSNPEQIFLRTERETFTRFPVSRAIAFTFKTYITPLPQLPVAVKRRLHDIIRQAPERYIAEYKRFRGERLNSLLEFLSQ